MKHDSLFTGLMMTALLFSAAALASDIYKSVDEDGNVRYRDRPSGAATEEVVPITYKRSSAAAVQRQRQSLADAEKARREQRSAAAEAAAAADDKAAEAAERQKQCEAYRARLETLLQANRVYREGPDGERVYLDGAEIDAARRRVEQQIEETCGP